MKGDASEGESTSTGGCISNWREMKKAYLRQQSSADVENSIFLVMFYDMDPPTPEPVRGSRVSDAREEAKTGSFSQTMQWNRLDTKSVSVFLYSVLWLVVAVVQDVQSHACQPDIP